MVNPDSLSVTTFIVTVLLMDAAIIPVTVAATNVLHTMMRLPWTTNLEDPHGVANEILDQIIMVM